MAIEPTYHYEMRATDDGRLLRAGTYRHAELTDALAERAATLRTGESTSQTAMGATTTITRVG